MNQLTQGAILYGVRSDKYPNTCCYGVIISASCDIANCKVPKFYFLTAVDAQKWLTTEVGYNQAYAEKIDSLSKKFNTAALNHSLNASLLQSLSSEDFGLVIDSQIAKIKDKNNIKNIYEQYRVFFEINMDDKMRKTAIRTDNSPATKYLEKVAKGEIIHYYYLPQDAYSENGKKNMGLIVDLQEIEILLLDDAEKIQSPGLDHMLLPKESIANQKRLRKHYWLETDDDFVAVDGIVRSPWREHLMQRFSHGFIRIGVDRPTAEDYSQLVIGI